MPKPGKKWDLQYKLIYSTIVAGKNAPFADAVMSRLFSPREYPFDTIRRHIRLGTLEKKLKTARTGNYGKFNKCLPRLVELDPEKCTLDELESVPGIGPKTARFFILWTRPGAKYAVLDTHILKYLRECGYDAPKSTPQSKKKYRELEQAFLSQAEKQGKTPRDLDWEIWSQYSGYTGSVQNNDFGASVKTHKN